MEAPKTFDSEVCSEYMGPDVQAMACEYCLGPKPGHYCPVHMWVTPPVKEGGEA